MPKTMIFGTLLTALWFSAKFKSASYIFDIADLQWTPSQISCKALNQKVIDEILAIIPPKTLERYQKYGVKLRVGDDIQYSDKAKWNASSAVYEDHDEYVVFSSPKLLTEAAKTNGRHFHGRDDSEGGDFFCKLLSPGKVAE